MYEKLTHIGDHPKELSTYRIYQIASTGEGIKEVSQWDKFNDYYLSAVSMMQWAFNYLTEQEKFAGLALVLLDGKKKKIVTTLIGYKWEIHITLNNKYAQDYAIVEQINQNLPSEYSDFYLTVEYSPDNDFALEAKIEVVGHSFLTSVIRDLKHGCSQTSIPLRWVVWQALRNSKVNQTKE